jgi:hopanoid biosynthesis associated protein HpnK
MRQLIVVADDFGAAQQVNEAVEAAHRAGILTAASLMVSGAAAADAVARARRMPCLSVGLHLAIVEARPTLPASAVGSLVNADGYLRSDMAALGALISVSPRARRELAAEIGAQFEAFRATGLTLDHCNAHKHFHLHPVVGRLIAEIGSRFGLRAVRVPLEPVRVLRQVEPRTPWIGSLAIAPAALWLRRRARAAGLLAADRVFGLQWSGQMTRQRLAALIERLPEGLTEIYLHPACGPYEGSAPGYRYRDELEALLAPEARAACAAGAIETGGFLDFLDRGRARRPVALRMQEQAP